MHRLIRFYNQNRKDIWKVIGIIVIIIIVLQLLNYSAKKTKQEKINNNADQSTNQEGYNNVKQIQ